MRRKGWAKGTDDGERLTVFPERMRGGESGTERWK